jgi:hypothetical protein
MSRRRILTIAVLPVLLLVLLVLLASKVKFTFYDDIHGFFVLEGDKGYWLELTDDIYPETANRLLWGKSTRLFSSAERSSCGAGSSPCLEFEWNERTGHGYVMSVYPDGSKLLFNLGRFIDDSGKVPSGIFIGGGLPPSDPDYQHLNRNETGMAYFDGTRWYHIWCNVNEGLSSVRQPYLMSYPSDWTFRGSKVLENDGRHLSLQSRHDFRLDNVPCTLDRYLFYTAGAPYVVLVTEITNRGEFPLSLRYTYSDEPWLGNFGSARGNVGWLKDGIVLTERIIDTSRNTFAGMFDYGNELAGEDHDYTWKANFIEWDRKSRPDKAYFSNIMGGLANYRQSAPLSSPKNRIIGLIWGPLTIPPGQSFTFTLAIGMAGNDPATGFPVKPETDLNRQ